MNLPNFPNLFPNPDNFPVDFLPPLIKDAILEVQRNTHFPLPLIVSSALGAVSLACQNSIDVRTPLGSVTPCSLFMLLIADSGEGKTPTDNFFMKPIRDFQESEAKKIEDALPQQQTLCITWESKLKEIKKAIEKNHKDRLSLNPEQVTLLKLEPKLEELNQKLEAHLSEKPKQRNYKLIASDTSPMKIASDLYKKWPSMGLISDEAGSIFKGKAMKDLGMLNTLWDGAQLTVDRSDSTSAKDPSFTVKDARLTISLMVQGKIFTNYLNGRGDEARDIGFIARCLVASPLSTKGTRRPPLNPSWDYLTKFQQRITKILTQDKLDVDEVRQTRPILEFSQNAKNNWQNNRDRIETELNPGRYLSDISDAASKLTTNIARMAALFHFFEGKEGDISAETLSFATEICMWYINEFKRLFEKKPDIPINVSDAHELEQWLVTWCNQNFHHSIAIKKSDIAQRGPFTLRKKNRLEPALNELAAQNKIVQQLQEKTQWVVLNPYVFSLPNNFSAYLFPYIAMNTYATYLTNNSN